MVNIENFSIESYREILKRIKKNYKIIDYSIIDEKMNKKTILIRHDSVVIYV